MRIFGSTYLYLIFFFNDTATTEIYTLSLHDALPIWMLRSFSYVTAGARLLRGVAAPDGGEDRARAAFLGGYFARDRKSTRLNSSHANISYAVFCLKKKKYKTRINTLRYGKHKNSKSM